jgi:biotin carboxyl carrier protein
MRLVEALHCSKLQLIRIEAPGLQINISKTGVAEEAVSGHTQAPAATSVMVRSPQVGVFRSATAILPGTQVDSASMLGSVETLDLSTPVQARIAGTMAEQLEPDGAFVEYGQSIYRIFPTAAPQPAATGQPTKQDHLA